MDVQLFTLASENHTKTLQAALERLGYVCFLDDILKKASAYQTTRNGLKLLYLHSCHYNEQLWNDVFYVGRPWFDMILLDSPELLLRKEVLDKAFDVCLWPTGFSELQLRMDRLNLLHERQIGTENQLTQDLDELCLSVNMIGQCPAFQTALTHIKKFAITKANILIVGDTGTGKELAARAIHYLSPCHNGPFKAVNCGAIPDHLFENELFGHERGAYTDANSTQPGIVECANGGTLFLDEVDALSSKAQVALLRFLQDRTYLPLGAKHEKHVDVRIIAATNTNLTELAANGKFREDLLFRLNLLSVRMPPLCERKGDINLLAVHFLRQCHAEYGGEEKILHPTVIHAMLNYNWTGNIRELENFINRAYLLSEGPVIYTYPEQIFRTDNPSNYVEPAQTVACFNEAKHQVIAEFEQDYIIHLLEQTKGNISKAAQLAGKERRALGKLIKKYGIDSKQFSLVNES